MSLLRRIESARPASELAGMPETAGVGGPTGPMSSPPAQSNLPAVTQNNVSAPSGSSLSTGRMLAQVPLRESFRDAKFRIQQRVIQDLDPKLDLSNQVEVRREIDEAFGR